MLNTLGNLVIKTTHSRMVIVSTKFEYAEGSPFSDWNLTRYRIDPKSNHQTPLPGDHTTYSYVTSKKFENWIDPIQNFQIRADDIWIIGIPKSGTTWVHNIVYKLKNGLDCSDIANKLEELYFEKDAESINDNPNWIQRFNDTPSPRIFKSHLPAFLLPKQLWTIKPKIIYTIRNPKDCVISEYHMVRNSVFGFSGSFEEYAVNYIHDTILGSPFFDHLKGFLQFRLLKHIFYNFYEDLVANQFDGIRHISNFIECPHTDDQLCKIVDDVSFDKMQKEFTSFWLPDDKSAIPDPDYK